MNHIKDITNALSADDFSEIEGIAPVVRSDLETCLSKIPEFRFVSFLEESEVNKGFSLAHLSYEQLNDVLQILVLMQALMSKSRPGIRYISVVSDMIPFMDFEKSDMDALKKKIESSIKIVNQKKFSLTGNTRRTDASNEQDIYMAPGLSDLYSG